MKYYTIRCTPEQTKKALCLGAPIEIKYGSIGHRPSLEELKYLFAYDNIFYIIPTAEEMISWLEKQEHIDCIDIVKSCVVGENEKWQFAIWDKNEKWECGKHGFNSRKEATLAAIDSAFEYLETTTMTKEESAAYWKGAKDQHLIDVNKAWDWVERLLGTQSATPDFVEESRIRFMQAMEE